MERVKFRTTSQGEGTVSNIFIEPNSRIVKGEKIFTILMDNNELVVKSHIDGAIKEIYVKEGDKISDRGLLCDILTTEEIKKIKNKEFENSFINTFDALPDIEVQSNKKKDDEYITELLNQKVNSSFDNPTSSANIDLFSSAPKQNDNSSLISIKKEIANLSSQLDDLDLFAKDIERNNESKFNDLQSKFGAINGRVNKELAVQIKELSDKVTMSLSDDATRGLKDRVNSLHSLVTKTNNRVDEVSKKLEESLLNDEKYDDSALVAKIKSLNENLYTLKNKIESVQEVVQNQSFEYDDSIIVSKIKSTNEVLHAIKSRIETIESTLDSDAIKYDDTALVSKVKSTNEALYNLKNKFDSLEENINNLDLEYDDSVIVSKIKSTNETLYNLKNKFDSLEDTVKNQSFEYDDSIIVSKIKSTNEVLHELKNKIDNLEKVISETDNEYDDTALVSKVKSTNEALYNLKNKFDALEESFNSLDIEYDDSNLQSKIKALSENIYSYKNKFDEIEETISQLDFQYDDSVIVSKIRSLSESIQSIKDKLQQIEENIETLDIEYDDSSLISKIKSLSEALSTVNNKVDSIDLNEIKSEFESKLDDVSRNNKITKESLESKLLKNHDGILSLNDKYDSLRVNQLDPSKFVSKNEIDKIIKNAINDHEAILKSKNKLDKLEEQVKDYKIDPSKFVNSSDIEKIVKSAISDHESIIKSKAKLEDLETKVKESKHEQVKFVSKNEIDKIIKNVINDHEAIIKSKVKLDDLETKVKENKFDPSKFITKSDIDKIVKSSISDHEATIRSKNKISDLESKVSTMNSYQKKIDKMELEIFSYKNALKDQATQIKELEKIIKSIKPGIEFKEVKTVKPVKQASLKKPKMVSKPVMIAEDETFFNTPIEEIRTKHIKLRDFKRKYDLSKLIDFHTEHNFHTEDVNAPVRLDFIFYKAIIQSLGYADIDNYDDITLPKLSNDKLSYKRLDIKDKSLTFIYENQNKIAKKAEDMGVVSIIDDQIKETVLEKFKNDKIARILIIFESLTKTEDDTQSIVIKFIIKSSVAENKILGFLDDLDRIIGSPELIK